jgi:hypothetical protein
MNPQINYVLALKGTVVTRLKSLQQGRRFAACVLGPLIVGVMLAVVTIDGIARQQQQTPFEITR